MTPGVGLRLGLAVTTVGRPALQTLLLSAGRSSCPPKIVVIANQSGAPLSVDTRGMPFDVDIVDSSSGASRGRNDAFSVLKNSCDVVGFPNDDTYYEDDIFAEVLSSFVADRRTAVVACRLKEPDGSRFVLPPTGTYLDRRTVWRAIEPAMFVATAAFVDVGGFRGHIGTGAGSAWGSGEGTDLLLRLMAAGGGVLSRPDLAVYGMGERRELDDDSLVRKHRAYARGTGYVYRTHDYPLWARARTLVGPLVKAWRHDAALGLSLRLAAARSLGRLEGLSGRSLERGNRQWRTPDPGGGSSDRGDQT